MAESNAQYIQFDHCEIDVAGFELRRNGSVVAIEPQVLELLLCLARNPDRLLTKDDLIAEVWHGRLVSDTTITSRIKSARRAIGDDGQQQRLIKTVHGRGVRFVAEVRTETRPCVMAGFTGGNAVMATAAPAEKVTAIAARSKAPATIAAIAVLPFANSSGDAAQDYFVDGLSEDIITDLSRFRELRVVARDSSFHHRASLQQGGDLQQVGRALSADYIVTGSVRRHGARLRLTAQLTAVESGTQVWAERYDRDAEDVFQIADGLVRTIAATTVGRVRSVGSALVKRKAPANLAAYECVLRGTAAQARIGDPQQEADARRFFEQALELDPDYPRAHAGLAIVLLCEWVRESGTGDETLDRALEHASKAVAIDGEDYECREALGWILLHCKSYELSEHHYRRAIELNPNSPAELAAMGAACAFLGRAVEGIDWFQLARRIDPFFDATWYWHLLGVACFNARRYDEALVALKRPADTPIWVRCYMAACHAHLGRPESAHAIAAAIAKEAPRFRAEDLVRKEPYRNPEDLRHFADGLKKAGLLDAGRARAAGAYHPPAMGRAPTFGFKITAGRLPRPV